MNYLFFRPQFGNSCIFLLCVFFCTRISVKTLRSFGDFFLSIFSRSFSSNLLIWAIFSTLIPFEIPYFGDDFLPSFCGKIPWIGSLLFFPFLFPSKFCLFGDLSFCPLVQIKIPIFWRLIFFPCIRVEIPITAIYFFSCLLPVKNPYVGDLCFIFPTLKFFPSIFCGKHQI